MHRTRDLHIWTIAARLLVVCALALVWLASADLQLVAAVAIGIGLIALVRFLGDNLWSVQDRYDTRWPLSRQL